MREEILNMEAQPSHRHHNHHIQGRNAAARFVRSWGMGGPLNEEAWQVWYLINYRRAELDIEDIARSSKEDDNDFPELEVRDLVERFRTLGGPDIGSSDVVVAARNKVEATR